MSAFSAICPWKVNHISPPPPPLQTEESRVVLHFHYTQWPDFGVPQAADIFLEFLYAVRSSGVLGSDVGPSVVHCSAGIGRSGTFCLADVCLAKVCRLSLRLSVNAFYTSIGVLDAQYIVT